MMLCLRFVVLVVLFGFLGCHPKPPACELSASAADGLVGKSAGCLIYESGLLLMVKDKESRRWGFPAGFAHANETAQCTAQRETWEETGVAVKVGALVKRYPNGFHLYRCYPTSDVVLEPKLPKWAETEIEELRFVLLSEMSAGEWRYPEQYREFEKLLSSGGLERSG